LLSRRPDLRRSERELAAATARIGVATADLFPRFNLLGSFGRRSDDLGDFDASSQFWSAGFGFRWPILAGGRIRANIRVQEARQEQALLQYEKAILTALEEVENALSAHGRELRRRDSLGASVAANRRALELATDRYASGLEDSSRSSTRNAPSTRPRTNWCRARRIPQSRSSQSTRPSAGDGEAERPSRVGEAICFAHATLHPALAFGLCLRTTVLAVPPVIP